MTQGIYCIENIKNHKKYIGKSINIEKRFSQHKYTLKKGNHHNQYLQKSYDKYGKSSFKYYILEVVEDVLELSFREMFWIDHFNTLDKNLGYNLLYDSPDGYLFHPTSIEKMSLSRRGVNNPNYGNFWSKSQKDMMSKIAIDRHRKGVYGDDWKVKISEASKNMWKDEERKSKMAKSVSEAKSQSYFLQLDKHSNKLIKRWDSVQDILIANSSWKWQNIYAACNGSKKSYMGFRWKRIPKMWQFKKPSENEFNQYSGIEVPWEMF